MDFAALHQGAFQLAAGIATVINLSFAPPIKPIETNLQYPSLISSYNLSSEVTGKGEESGILTDLITSPDEDLNLKLVMKEPEIQENVVTVEAPIIFTVKQPSTKPVAKPAERFQKPEIGVEIVKEVKADLPSPTPIPSPSASPSLIPVPQGNSNSEQLFQMVNDYRLKLGLKAFEKEAKICAIAEQRAPQVNGELKNGTLHQGFKALNLPYWATENIAAYSTIEENLKFWLSDYIHKKAIESDHKYSCVSCAGASCSQIFTTFIEK